MNEGVCRGNWSGSFDQDGGDSRLVTFEIDENGVIFNIRNGKMNSFKSNSFSSSFISPKLFQVASSSVIPAFL